MQIRICKPVKRFTETNKWSDPWFRKLSSPAKQLWEYLCDHCDLAGVVEIDYALTSQDCGQKVGPEHIKEMGDRVQTISTGKFFLPKFIRFQYGELSDSCPPHRSVIKLVKAYGLLRVGLGYAYPNATLAEGTVYPQDKDKDKEKEKEKDSANELPLGITPKAKFEKPTIEAVKLQCAKIGLPESEAEHFWAYYESNGWKVGRNPMKSWPAALTNWKLNHQNGGYSKPAQGNGAQTVVLNDELRRVETKIKAIRDSYADHQTWSDQDRQNLLTLKNKQKQLRKDLGLE